MDKMTYRQLLVWLLSLTDEQLNCDLTVEDLQGSECFPAKPRICGTEHGLLDEDHPVICF